MARSIYVPMDADDLALLAAMAKAERRNPHAQAAYLLSQALRRWGAEQDFERSLAGEVLDELEEVA